MRHLEEVCNEGVCSDFVKLLKTFPVAADSGGRVRKLPPPHSKSPGGKMVILPPDFGSPRPPSGVIFQVNKTGASQNRKDVKFDGYRAFYGATYPFVL